MPDRTRQRCWETSRGKKVRETHNWLQRSTGARQEVFVAEDDEDGRISRRKGTSVLYVKRFEALALKALLRSVGTLLVFKGTDLHTVVFVLGGILHKGDVVFSLQASGDSERIVLPLQRRDLQHVSATRNQGCANRLAASHGGRRGNRVGLGLGIDRLRRSGSHMGFRRWLEMRFTGCGLIDLGERPGARGVRGGIGFL